MKAGRGVDFAGARTSDEAALLLLRIRFAECLSQSLALAGENDEAIHAFRLSCKRLRFAIERFAAQRPQLKAAADLLKQMTDELGRAHDCVVLAQRAANVGAALAAAHARRDRDRYVERARQEWRRAFGQDSPFALLAQATGYTWSDE